MPQNEKNSPGASNMLVMGPWCHGGWARSEGDRLGDVQFDAKTSGYFRENIEFPFFEFHLKGKGDAKLPEAYVFETGSNQWRQYDAWPPKNVSPEIALLRCRTAGCRSTPPAEAEGFDEYVSDPAKPVPYIDRTDTGMTARVHDGRPALRGRRTDVLVYQTDPLEEDVTLAGPFAPAWSFPPAAPTRIWWSS